MAERSWSLRSRSRGVVAAGGGAVGADAPPAETAEQQHVSPPELVAAPAARRRTSLPYVAGLDGLRALSIVAVLLYHAELAWIPGGFLGVEVFFVLSGYLMSSLLLAEWRSSGGIDVMAFWLRRARRLLPALYLLLAVTLCYAVFALPGELARLRADAMAALLFVTNWYLILHQQSYFEAVARPSLLQHLWSLAVEEQFYLLLPVLLGRALRRLRPKTVLLGLVLAALASSLWMAWLYRPELDPSRVYYGTDTRAAGLLLGAALAFVWWPRRAAGRPARYSPALDALGAGALLILLWCVLALNAYEPALYRGGFALVALATSVLIVVLVDPRAHLGRLILGLPALRWLGRRSYSVYLWHWPVFMLTRPQLDLPISGVPLVALRLLLTLLLAEASYRSIEMPLRSRGVRRSFAVAVGRARAALREVLSGGAPVERRLAGAVWAVDAGIAALLCLAIAVAVALAKPPPTPSYLTVSLLDTTQRGAGTAKSAPTPAAPAAASASAVPARSEVTATVAPPPTATPPPATPAQALPALDADASPAAQQPTAGAVQATPPALATATPVLPAPEPTVEPSPTAPPTSSPPPAEPSPPSLPAVASEPAASPASEPAAPAPYPPPDQAVVQVAAPSEPPTPEPVSFGRVGAVGDSVMLSAGLALQGAIPDIQINAEVSRQVDVALGVLQIWQANGELGDVTVVHIGNNGVFLPEQFDAVMQTLAGVPRVYFLTVKVPRPWEAPNNAVIAEGVARYPNARLIDWRAASIDHPEYFWDDGIHLRPEGAVVYADLVRAQLSAP